MSERHRGLSRNRVHQRTAAATPGGAAGHRPARSPSTSTTQARAVPHRVFVLGAGFSIAAGFPLAYELLTGVFAQLDIPARDRLVRTLAHLYPKFPSSRLDEPLREAAVGRSPGPRTGSRGGARPTLERALGEVHVEEFMSLLDMNEQFTERLPNDQLTTHDISALRGDLLRGIAALLVDRHLRAERTVGKVEYVHRFVTRLRPTDSVVTFNWDVLLERCVRQRDLEVDYTGQGTGERSRTILKLHGSVDWYRAADVPSTIDRQPVHRQIYRIGWDALTSTPTPVRAGAAPFVMPPTFFKNLLGSTDLEELWAIAFARLRDADEVHFCGYRLPPEDLFARAMLRRALRANALRRERLGQPGPRVTVVNPDPEVAAAMRRTLFPTITANHARFQESAWAR